MELTNISCVKRLMNEENIKFQKKFGQNFLINPDVPRRIADECQTDRDSVILEIGPGIGTLTQYLCENFKKVIAVEIDGGLIPILSKTLAEYDNVTVINADIMKTDLSSLAKEYFDGEKVSVCANLPYYITTPVITKLCESGVLFDTITVMVQKEVASRICSSCDSSDWGAISLFCSYYAKTRKLFDVAPGNFMPPPKVTSTVMQFDMYKEPPVVPKDVNLMFSLIKKAFEQRRKTLVNALSGNFGVSKDDIRSAIIKMGKDENVRGEVLSLEEFSALSDMIYDIISPQNA